MKLFKKIFPVALGLLLLSGTAFAQGQQMQMNDAAADSISDKELKSFVKTTKEVQMMDQKLRMEMQSIIQEEDISMQRFQQIMQSQQNPQAAGDVEVTEEEQEIINKIQPKLQKVGQETQQKQITVVQESSLTLQRYQQIAQTVRSNPAMMQKVQKMMTDSTDQEMEEEDGDGN